jgi:sterol 24-C-methyltransferase
MSPIALEKEDHTRDKQFAAALHGKSAQGTEGLSAILNKDKSAQKAAVDEYFKHWDNKPAETETESTREQRRTEYATLTKQ